MKPNILFLDMCVFQYSTNNLDLNFNVPSTAYCESSADAIGHLQYSAAYNCKVASGQTLIVPPCLIRLRIGNADGDGIFLFNSPSLNFQCHDGALTLTTDIEKNGIPVEINDAVIINCGI